MSIKFLKNYLTSSSVMTAVGFGSYPVSRWLHSFLELGLLLHDQDHQHFFCSFACVCFIGSSSTSAWTTLSRKEKFVLRLGLGEVVFNVEMRLP